MQCIKKQYFKKNFKGGASEVIVNEFQFNFGTKT